jgi:hypothetical protein
LITKERRKIIRKLQSPDKISSIANHINNEIGNYGLTKMLEIGSDLGLLVESIKIDKIFAVDPTKNYKIPFKFRHIKFFEMTSDEFFERSSDYFDLIYIDGLHTFEQSFTDLINSMNRLKSGGPSLIYLDDVLPNDEFSSFENPFEAFEGRKRLHGQLSDLSWMGSVYKIIPLLIESEFSYSTLNLDGKYVTRIKFDHISNTDIDGLKKKLLVAKKNSNLKSYAFKDIKLEYYKLI